MRRILTATSGKRGVNGLELVVQTDNTGVSNDDQFTIPINSSYTYNYNVQTSDGQTFNNLTTSHTITFPVAGEYTVTISGDFPSIYFFNADDDTKVTGISNWGDPVYSTCFGAFRGCTNLANITATDTPNTSLAVNASSMFYDCASLITIDISNWDFTASTQNNLFFRGCTSLTNLTCANVIWKTSGNTRHDSFFYACSSLVTVDLTTWDMSGTTRIDSFFGACTNLATPILTNWDLSNCTTFGSMFADCDGLVTIDLSSWTLASANLGVGGMFSSCDALTSVDLTGWDTSLTTNFVNMFNGSDLLTDCSSIENFDMSSATSVSSMLRFVGADCDLSSWDISNVSNGSNFWANQSTLSTANYDAILIAWEATLQGYYPAGAGYTLTPTWSFGSARYTPKGDAETARTSLINTFNWNISDGGANTDLFIIQVKTDNTGTSNDDQFTLPFVGTYDVNWGDGNYETSVSGTQTHTYSVAGTYDIEITATSGRVLFNNGGDKDKLLDIKQWGTCEWTNMVTSFYGCSNLDMTATDSPNLSSATAIYNAFRACTSLNGDFSNWDVTNIARTDNMFYGCTALQGTGIGSWNTSSITNMNAMFRSTSVFDEDLSGWDINQVTSFGQFITGSSLSTANYDALLIAWDAQGAMSYSGTVSFGSSQYTSGGAAETARTSLIAKWGGISDGGAV